MDSHGAPNRSNRSGYRVFWVTPESRPTLPKLIDRKLFMYEMQTVMARKVTIKKWGTPQKLAAFTIVGLLVANFVTSLLLFFLG